MTDHNSRRVLWACRCLSAVLLLAGCSSSTQSAAVTQDAAAEPTGPQLDDLFTSADVPRCENTFTSQYQLKGSIDGQDVNYGDGFITYLDSTSLSFAAIHLTWSDPLAEDTAIRLTGATVIVPAGHPLEGQVLCITEGKFGSPTVKPGDPGRQFLFEITGTTLGLDCSGRDVPIHVHGCLIRTNTYFPMPARKDAG